MISAYFDPLIKSNVVCKLTAGVNFCFFPLRRLISHDCLLTYTFLISPWLFLRRSTPTLTYKFILVGLHPLNMKVLVAGAAGFIGSHTILELLESGHQVYAIDNFYNAVEGDEFLGFIEFGGAF